MTESESESVANIFRDETCSRFGIQQQCMVISGGVELQSGDIKYKAGAVGALGRVQK